MGFDFYLIDRKTNEAFYLGDKIWWGNILDTPENQAALTDPEWLAEYIHSDLEYTRHDPKHKYYRAQLIPWISERLQEFMKDRKLDQLIVLSDQHEEYQEEWLGKEQLVGSRYPEDYVVHDGVWAFRRNQNTGRRIDWEFLCICEDWVQWSDPSPKTIACPNCQRNWDITSEFPVPKELQQS